MEKFKNKMKEKFDKLKEEMEAKKLKE